MDETTDREPAGDDPTTVTYEELVGELKEMNPVLVELAAHRIINRRLLAERAARP